MRRLVYLFLLLAFSRSLYGQAGIVSGQFTSNAQGNNGAAVSSWTSGNIPNPVTIGNYVLVYHANCGGFFCGGSASSAHMNTATDALGNTYRKCADSSGGTPQLFEVQFYAKVEFAGTVNVTTHALFGSNTYNNYTEAVEVQGISPEAVCQAYNSSTQPGTTTTPSISSFNPVPCGQFVWGGIEYATPTSSSGTRMFTGSHNWYQLTTGAALNTLTWVTDNVNPNLILSTLQTTDACNVGVNYYSDFTAGSDSYDGLEKTHTTGITGPFKYVPGHASCSALCANVSAQMSPADSYLLKGGETWTYATAGQLTLTGKTGLADRPITFGADETWYTGGSFSKPKLDGEYNTSASKLVLMSNVDYVVFDNWEVTGAWSNYDKYGLFGPAQINYDQGQLFSWGDSDHITWKHMYLHGWRQLGTGTRTDGLGGALITSGGSGATDHGAHKVIEDSIVTNIENYGSGTSTGLCGRRVGTITRTVCHDVASAWLQTVFVDGSEVYNQSYPIGNVSPCLGCPVGDDSHPNGIYVDPGSLGETVGYVRNSKVHDISGGSNPIYCLANTGASVYAYNNLIYGFWPGGNGFWIDPYSFSCGLPDACGGSCYIINNTFDSSNSGAMSPTAITCSCFPFCDRPKSINVTISGNHLIGDNLSLTCANSGNVSGTLLIENNTPASGGQDPIVAAAQGYDLAHFYEPQNCSGITIHAGADNSATFTTDILHRTRTVAWDSGAYESPCGDGASSTGGGKPRLRAH